MRVGCRSGPKYGIQLTLKPTSFVDSNSIKKNCVQIVGKILEIYKDWKEILKKATNFVKLLSKKATVIPFFIRKNMLIFKVYVVNRRSKIRTEWNGFSFFLCDFGKFVQSAAFAVYVLYGSAYGKIFGGAAV